jgi:hypothetical protein
MDKLTLTEAEKKARNKYFKEWINRPEIKIRGKNMLKTIGLKKHKL